MLCALACLQRGDPLVAIRVLGGSLTHYACVPSCRRWRALRPSSICKAIASRHGVAGRRTILSKRRARHRGTKFPRRQDAERNECKQYDSLGDGERRFLLRWRQRVEEWHLLKGLNHADKHIQVQRDQGGRQHHE